MADALFLAKGAKGTSCYENHRPQQISDAQRFTELTDGCWHNCYRKDGYWHDCYKCEKQYKDSDNLTYSNAADILNRMRTFCGEEKYRKFIKTISYEKHIDYREAYGEPDERYFVQMSLTDFINNYILNAPALLRKAIEFLEEKSLE